MKITELNLLLIFFLLNNNIFKKKWEKSTWNSQPNGSRSGGITLTQSLLTCMMFYLCVCVSTQGFIICAVLKLLRNIWFSDITYVWKLINTKSKHIYMASCIFFKVNVLIFFLFAVVCDIHFFGCFYTEWRWCFPILSWNAITFLSTMQLHNRIFQSYCGCIFHQIFNHFLQQIIYKDQLVWH